MEGVMTMTGAGFAGAADGRVTVVSAAVPATMDPTTSADAARVAKVRGRGEVHHHLENLGFVEGAVVRVVSEQAGNYIVEVKGAQVALDRSVASKIITAAA